MEIKPFRQKFSQIKIVDKNQKGFMRQNCQEISVRIYAEKMCTNFSKNSYRKISTVSRIYVQFWLVSNAHKFSEDSCGILLNFD